MKYTVYDPATGKIQYTLSSNDSDTAELNLQGLSWIEGDYSGDQYYVDAGQAVSLPSRPQGFYDFDYQQRIWVLNSAETELAARYQRDQYLSELDRVGPVWYNSLTAEQQAELATYRSALLAVPQQSTFPTSIDWPAKPTWL